MLCKEPEGNYWFYWAEDEEEESEEESEEEGEEESEEEWEEEEEWVEKRSGVRRVRTRVKSEFFGGFKLDLY